MDFVTLKSFDSAIEAHELKNTLEFKGIKVFLRNEHIMSLLPVSSRQDCFKVQVPKDQIPEAQEILKRMENGEFDLYKNINLN